MSATSRVYIGGLMRCCIETIRTTETEDHEGDKLACKYHDRETPNMVYNKGGWRWIGVVSHD